MKKYFVLISLFSLLYFVFNNLKYGGEGAVSSYIIILILNFPISIIFQFILEKSNMIPEMQQVSVYFIPIVILILGMIQWLIIIPFLFKKIKKK